jgi:hypothetical protein
MTLPTTPVMPQVLCTKEAAVFLNRKPQTLRKWSCLGNGPILDKPDGQPPVRLKPISINGRLAWRIADLMKLLGQEIAQ